MRVGLALSGLAFLLGCASPFANSSQRYLDRAHEAESQGRWEDAYAVMTEAVGAADRPPNRWALHQHLGVTAGVTCRYDEAERELLFAHDLWARTGEGVGWLSLLELSELAFAREDYVQTVAYGRRALDEIGDRPGVLAASTLFLDDYATALERTGDHAGAVAMHERVMTLRQEQPAPSYSIARWPFGRFCSASAGLDLRK